MSPAAWMASRTPPAPEALMAHMSAQTVGRGATAQAGEKIGYAALADTMLDACDAALGRVLDADADSRNTALDLLSADAFVTYAFESAADDPSTIAARAESAMRRISGRAAPYVDREAHPA